MSKKFPSRAEAVVTTGACVTVAALTSISLPWALGGGACWLVYRTYKKLTSK